MLLREYLRKVYNMGRKDLTLLFKEKHNFIQEKRIEGQTYKDIALNVGCSVSALRNYCIKNNINGDIKKSIIGKLFNKSQLIVLDLDLNPSFKSHETAYKCKCNICGNVATYRKTNILKGPGCHSCSGFKGGRGYKDWEIGQKFGFIEILGKSNGRIGYIIGKCECGAIREFSLQHLRGHHHSRTISCGCKQKSSGEIKIENILKENKINYKTQYQIKDFSSYAKFDFAIFDKQNNLIKLIEYDGEQHFYPIEHFGGNEQFLIQQNRDQRKNDWCEKNNISLLRIPYWDYDKIDIKYLKLP